jgi:protein-S-isoprenylcysteine O-methyltransferase Ste14
MMRRRLYLAVHGLCNLACAGYFVYVAQLQLSGIEPDYLLIPVLLLAACLALAIAMLLRPPALQLDARAGVLVVVLFSKLYYLAIDLSHPVQRPWQVEVGMAVLGVGALSWCLCVSWLGRSFAILPAVRAIKVTGPYAVVRHPVYSSYLLIDAGILISFPSWRNAALVAAAASAYFARAIWEERLLATTQEYRAYLDRVRGRFFPRIV